MTIPLLTPLPPPPLPTDPESVFDSKAGATLSAQKTLVDEMNVNVIPAFNQTAQDADGAALAAQGYAQDAFDEAERAAQEAVDAETAKGLAEDARDTAQGYASAANNSAIAAGNSANAADGFAQAAANSASDAEDAKLAAAGFAQDAEYWADQAQQSVEGGIIDDDSLLPTRVRSALDTSRGNFKAVSVTTNTTIGVLDFAQITNADESVTVTLPAEPEAGQLVMVGNLTDRNDHLIAVGAIPVKGQDAGGYIVIDKPYYTVTLKFVSAGYGWELL